MIRDAAAVDLPALLTIHNDAIATTTAIWDEQPVDLDSRRQWFRMRGSSWQPVLVAELDGKFAGYASYGAWRPKAGYRSTMENSVYVHPAVSHPENPRTVDRRADAIRT